jgi:hypothetical protein
MTKQYDDEMKGIIFLEERRSDNHPDYKGRIQIDGVQYWVSGWSKETRKGQAISLSLQKAKPASEAMHQQKPVQQSAPEPQFFDDDIPF